MPRRRDEGGEGAEELGEAAQAPLSLYPRDGCQRRFDHPRPSPPRAPTRRISARNGGAVYLALGAGRQDRRQRIARPPPRRRGRSRRSARNPCCRCVRRPPSAPQRVSPPMRIYLSLQPAPPPARRCGCSASGPTEVVPCPHPRRRSPLPPPSAVLRPSQPPSVNSRSYDRAQLIHDLRAGAAAARWTRKAAEHRHPPPQTPQRRPRRTLQPRPHQSHHQSRHRPLPMSAQQTGERRGRLPKLRRLMSWEQSRTGHCLP